MRQRHRVSSQRLVEQYRSSLPLEERIAFHERFSTNPYPWLRWVFDHFVFPTACRVLEVGCGTGQLWRENAHRVGTDWAILLSDFSTGMMAKAKETVRTVPATVTFSCCRVERLPFAPASFDAVIANHLLYYVAEMDRTLAEIRRVLKPHGTLYATTNGRRHLREVDEVIVGFRAGPRPIASIIEAFNLENGGALLGRYFPTVALERRDDSVRVTDAAALVRYGVSLTRAEIPEARQTAFAAYVEQQLGRCRGALQITKDTGLFVAVTA